MAMHGTQMKKTQCERNLPQKKLTGKILSVQLVLVGTKTTS